MSITTTSIKRPIATTMVFLIIILVGYVGFRYLPVDLLPEIESPQLTVSVSYDNVGPEEMELIITDPLENALSGIPNVEQMNSSSSEGSSSITLEFSRGTNLDAASNNVRDALDRIRDDLPIEADAPRIRQFRPDDFPIVIIGVRSDRDLAELTQILEREVSMFFEQIPGVGTIDVWGGIGREIQVDLNRERLLSSNLTASDVMGALSRDNITLPGGDIKDGYSDFYVRTQGEFNTIDEISQTVITNVNGRPIRVGDVADVHHGYEEISRFVEIDGVPTLRLAIRKQSGANTVSVAEDIKSEVERINNIRGDMELMVITDQSQFIQDSINTVQNAAIWGGILAVIVLFAFLRNTSTTLIIGVSIPISIIATFGLLYFGGLTLNQMSFGGLALGIGLIVDNAIVVLENIVRKREQGTGVFESSAKGTKEVAGAIIAATLTTSVIFLPLVFMQTTTGSMFQELGLVVVFSIFCSLLVALTLVPMLSSRFMTIKPLAENVEDRSRGDRFFERVDSRYTKMLQGAVRYKWVVLSLTAVLFTVSILLIPGIPFELAPETEADEVRVSMRMQDGVNISVIHNYFEELDEIVSQLIDPDEVEYYTRDLGGWGGDGRIDINLVSQDERERSAEDIANDIRSNLGNVLPGADLRVYTRGGLWIMRRVFRTGGGDEDAAVGFQLRGYDLETSRELARNVRNRLERVPGVTDLEIEESEGRPQQDITINREKIAELGIGVDEVAGTIQTNIAGQQAGIFRVNGEERPIMVRLRPQDRVDMEDIGNISIRAGDDQIVPISSVIEMERSRAPTSVNRVDGQRVVYLTANLEDDVTLGEAVSRMESSLSEMQFPEGYSVYFGGEYEELQQAQDDFTMAIIFALVLVYMVMAAQFERFLDPLIVMFSVPVALIGVVPTLMITGTTINMQSLMGVLMLLGIVVNNAIVLVDYINLMRRRDETTGLLESIIAASRLRLRPILMTSFTTILAMVPLAVGIGVGAEIQAALARVVIGGLLASTFITLFLIPIVYLEFTRAVSAIKEWQASLLERTRRRISAKA
ncbi:AcrB/AcrD/AcrF family protein [Rhodohalobacter sp. SW132]|uniref:efflux RND transporter permease subunit n=1 Tax=Rhodohalobacter sp. SW132 TaxID=2293433 RepID=UPI000E2432F1|nr:efflux RND transporter permease subunit [Rhodohalobacter sp. SW132]REL37697.1 AcrB/AcrD/AcrF family protein [Rhodohalobacter sp. SW132]